jgi:hypothetical protein
VFHERRPKGKRPQNQDPAVAYFYSAAQHRSSGVLWSIFALALIVAGFKVITEGKGGFHRYHRLRTLRSCDGIERLGS